MKTGYNNFISFKHHGTAGDYKIIQDLKEMGDIILLNPKRYLKWMVEIPSYNISDRMFPTLEQAKSFVYKTLNEKVRRKG